MPALGAKVRVPAARRALVDRTRLTGRLPSFADGAPVAAAPRVVLVAAPAGFGKTTLITQWLRDLARSSAGPRVAWLSLDADDSDRRRFLTHLDVAIRSVPSGDPPADDLPTEMVLAELVDELDSRPGPTVICLDDYHLIEDREVHWLVRLLIDELPPKATVVIITRADPPLPIARLRARGELVEIRAADLRFSTDETGRFLNDIMGLGLSADRVTALGDRTEGWAVGLQLAALSARARAVDDRRLADFVASFSGSHRFVLDYLLDEVLAGQPEPVRTFLLQTCLLDRLTAELCNAVTGRADGRALLDRLESEGLFVVGLDDERHWFRYHHLFADALRARVPSELGDSASALHSAAARWLAAHGLLADAIRHAFAAGEQEYAATLIELALGDHRRRRQDPIMSGWAARLDPAIVRSRPLLATFTAWSRLADGDVAAVTPWLEAAEAALDDASAVPAAVEAPASLAADRDAELRELPSMIAVYRAAVAQARGDTDGTVVNARQALQLAGPDDHFPRAAAAGFIGQAVWAAGDLSTAIEVFSQAVDRLAAAGMRTDALGATVVLAQMWLGRGEPRRARSLYEGALGAATRHPGPILATTGDLHVGLADVLREQGELAAAEQHLQTARELGPRASLPENRHRWFATAAGVSRARGDLDRAVALLDRAEELYLPGYFPDLRPVPAIRARIRIAQGRLAEARDWADRRRLGVDDPVSYLREYELLTVARLLISEGDCAGAMTLLDRILTATESAGRNAGIVEARLIRALAVRTAGDPGAALTDVITAVSIGVPAGHCRLFLDEGPAVIELLTELIGSRGPGVSTELSDLARRLLDHGIAADATPAEQAGILLLQDQTLSERELEVLRLLATELSGPDIARRLFVSVNTLRTHTRHLYAKLGVNTRRAAVRRAAELNLF